MFDDGTTLLLLDDAAQSQEWMRLWARAYPETWYGCVDAADGLARMQEACAKSHGDLAVVAQGGAAAAVVSWWNSADWCTQQRTKAVIVCAPDDYQHCLQTVRFSCRTAWVCRADHAEIWRNDAEAAGARVLIPAPADAPQARGQWHWGMQLLAEMLDYG